MNPPTADAISVLRETLGSGMRVRMPATGLSMRPFIHAGEHVAFAPCHKGKPTRGEILLVRQSSGELLLHRVVRVDETGVYLRGDAQVFTEGPFSSEQIIARATGVVRNGRFIRLDRGPRRWVARLWHLTLPLRSLIVPPLRLLKRAWPASRRVKPSTHPPA
jgi:hypothetical protein